MEDIWFTVLGICFIFMMTTLGSAVVFFFKGEISPKLNAIFFGFASGIMIAASVWSLLLPAINESKAHFGDLAFFPAVVGILFGGIFIILLDIFLPKAPQTRASLRLFSAVTLHNIPEGLAVGFAFGASNKIVALGLALGIGFQNFPEGVAVALPMKRATKNNAKAFLWGMSSGIVEPIFACLGYFLATYLRILQPWLLAFSAGAMLFVCMHDLIPESKIEGKTSVGAWGALLGFVVMMTLDITLGGA